MHPSAIALSSWRLGSHGERGVRCDRRKCAQLLYSASCVVDSEAKECDIPAVIDAYVSNY
jgi:hypothetical protein